MRDYRDSDAYRRSCRVDADGKAVFPLDFGRCRDAARAASLRPQPLSASSLRDIAIAGER